MNLEQAPSAQCADEPIRVPGAIQPHGRMLVLRSQSGQLVGHSANWPDAGTLQNASRAVAAASGGLPPGESPAPVTALVLDGERYDVTAHRIGQLTIAEFEPSADASGPPPIYGLTRAFLPRLQTAQTVQQLAMLAVSEMKRLTGFGRCLIYRFDAGGHGEVLAEERDAGYDSYAGHCFPASDIPAQARELYLLNHIRLIPDANYTPVPLRCSDPSWQPQQLDLSYAALRSVSPVHLEYMRNMGTLASMSVSLVVRGQLWGLISCHHIEPHHLGYPHRVACEHLGRLLSLQLEAKEDNEAVAARLELRQLTLQIVSRLAESDGSLQRLVAEPALLLRLARASGAAVVLNDECWTVGETPGDQTIRELARWVVQRGKDVFQTDALSESVPTQACDPSGLCAGVLAISISQVHRHVILWFRPEVVRTVEWAGNPHKPMSVDDGLRLHPRRSFATWRESVRGRSRPWLDSEVAAVQDLRQALIGIVLRRAEEMASVATELGRVNKELEAFSYTVSHDLRAPMRHIAGYVDLVLDMEGKQLSERARGFLGHVKEASSFAGQLVDALLDFSRMGRAALKPSAVDCDALLDDLVRELRQQEPERRIEWQVAHPLPVLWADPFLLQVAVRNLLNNAVKYTRSRDPARIELRGVVTPAGCGLEVSDNGVGFQMKYVGKLFGVFQRLHQAEEFEGTGIGLANVRRIVERHGGTVWARGEQNQGASFGFTLPPQPERGA